jgi:hypothetical protein
VYVKVPVDPEGLLAPILKEALKQHFRRDGARPDGRLRRASLRDQQDGAPVEWLGRFTSPRKHSTLTQIALLPAWFEDYNEVR